MNNEKLPVAKNGNQGFLKEEVIVLKDELEAIEKKITAFEASLRAQLVNELIEEQELLLLDKKLKQAKKAKRLAQKKRGKNYKEPVGLKLGERKPVRKPNKEDEKERKRLYREAMLHVHPDKFSSEGKSEDLATEITSKLIEVYQSGNLEALQDYHAHIFGGNAELDLQYAQIVKEENKDQYLEKERDRLKAEISRLKSRHTYYVLDTYDDPMSFLTELRTYYTDRIMKLRRRTRKAKSTP